jgi:hypothetical protein
MIWTAIVETVVLPAMVFVGDSLDLVEQRADIYVRFGRTPYERCCGALATPAWPGHGAHLIS